MERESHISRNELHESLKMPRELMERFTNMTDLNLGLRSETRRAYFKCFLSALQFRLVPKHKECFPLYTEVDLGADCLQL